MSSNIFILLWFEQFKAKKPSRVISPPLYINFSHMYNSTIISKKVLPFFSFLKLAPTPTPSLIKKKIKLSSYIRKFQNGAVAKSDMTNGLLIYEYD